MTGEFRSYKIKHRIIGGYAIPVAVWMVASLLVYLNVQTVNRQTKPVEEAYLIVDHVKDLAFNIQSIQRITPGYLLEKNETSLKAFVRATEDFDKLAQELRVEVKDSEQRQTLDRMLKVGSQINAFNQDLIRLVDAGKSSEAIKVWQTSSGPQLAEELERLIQDFETREFQILHSRQKVQHRALTSLTVTVITSTILSVILIVMIGLWVASRISQMIQVAAVTISNSSSEIAATVEQQEQMAVQQASAVNQTTATMDELGASSAKATQQADASTENAHRVLVLAESSANAAHQVLGLAESGTQSVDQTLQGIASLKATVEAIADQIIRLSEQTNQISSVTSLVTDLANQTNMLALNAAVEAARAGENGRGFAVVAGEIRKLADQSKRSAEKINTLILDIQSAIGASVMAADEGKKSAEVGIKLSEATAQAFTHVTQAINQVVLSNQQTSLTAINDVVVASQQIALTTKQQAIAIQQVIDAMNALNQGAVQTASGISQTKVGIQQLNQAALNLKAIV